MSTLKLAREHLEGEHGAGPAEKCALCPACPSCAGKGVVMLGRGDSGVDITGFCRACGGTGSKKGTAR